MPVHTRRSRPVGAVVPKTKRGGQPVKERARASQETKGRPGDPVGSGEGTLTSDLYARLGVPRNADGAAIKQAYRSLSKSAHPDGGGTTAKFAWLREAYDVLSDQTRRRRYDETGEITPKNADNYRAEVVTQIAAVLDAAINQVAQSRVNLIEVDIVKGMLSILKNEMDQAHKTIALFETKRKKLLEIAGRFSRKDGTGTSPNILEEIVAGQLRGLDESAALMRRREQLLTEASALVSEYQFRMDARRQVIYAAYTASTSSTGFF